ncbi:putative effector protein [Ceratobasidium theobromae]|uniref:Putative effector protein n=1 Tax=Ceratobasidium theobromae TaxID=1582974 RepID=A0A5N5QAP7_9AGAM|nr:putative effector protein [Ceratobasidium theobromae]
MRVITAVGALALPAQYLATMIPFTPPEELSLPASRVIQVRRKRSQSGSDRVDNNYENFGWVVEVVAKYDGLQQFGTAKTVAYTGFVDSNAKWVALLGCLVAGIVGEKVDGLSIKAFTAAREKSSLKL